MPQLWQRVVVSAQKHTPKPVPAWLVGRWKVDVARLDPKRREELGAGIVDVTVDALAHHGFAKDAHIFDQSWPGPVARATKRGLIRIECDDLYDEVWLEVKKRDGDRLVVYLGGMDVLPWGREMPLVRVTR